MTDEESDGTRQKFPVFSRLLTNTASPARNTITVLAHLHVQQQQHSHHIWHIRRRPAAHLQPIVLQVHLQ